MRRAVHLHPVVTLLAATAGTLIAAIAGALIVVPACAVAYHAVLGYQEQETDDEPVAPASISEADAAPDEASSKDSA